MFHPLLTNKQTQVKTSVRYWWILYLDKGVYFFKLLLNIYFVSLVWTLDFILTMHFPVHSTGAWTPIFDIWLCFLTIKYLRKNSIKYHGLDVSQSSFICTKVKTCREKGQRESEQRWEAVAIGTLFPISLKNKVIVLWIPSWHSRSLT